MDKMVKMLKERALKYGAPEIEALYLAISRGNCEQCRKSHVFGGKCSGIRNNKDYADNKENCCKEFLQK